MQATMQHIIGLYVRLHFRLHFCIVRCISCACSCAFRMQCCCVCLVFVLHVCVCVHCCSFAGRKSKRTLNTRCNIMQATMQPHTKQIKKRDTTNANEHTSEHAAEHATNAAMQLYMFHLLFPKTFVCMFYCFAKTELPVRSSHTNCCVSLGMHATCLSLVVKLLAIVIFVLMLF